VNFGEKEASDEAVRNYGFLVTNAWQHIVTNLLKTSPTEQYSMLRITITYPVHWNWRNLSLYRGFVDEGARRALANVPGCADITIDIHALNESYATLLSRCRVKPQEQGGPKQLELVDKLCEPGERMAIWDMGGGSAVKQLFP
jgi:hypothetical protein